MADSELSRKSTGQGWALSQEDLNAQLQHIEHYFGPVSFILSEEKWEHLKLDIAVIEPTAERRFYMLITMGFGALEQSDADGSERVELVIMLHDNWIVPSAEEKYYWPIRLLKNIVRLCVTEGKRITCGTRYDNKGTFCEETELHGAMIYYLNRLVPYGAQSLQLPGDREIFYYSVTPLYLDELEEMLENGPTELLNAMTYTDPLVDNKRSSAMGSRAEYDAMIMDDVRWHAWSIDNKEYPVPRENAASHLAHFLRYMIENGMMSESFMQAGSELVEDITSGRNKINLRDFIIEQLNSVLDNRFFNEKGMVFVQHYYKGGTFPYYASDIDSYAHNYFTQAEYYSEEFDTDGYLFVPYDETYYQNIKKVIDARRTMLENLQSDADDEALALSELMKMWLACKCTYFPGLSHEMPLMSCYAYALRQAPVSDYVPVLIEVSSELFSNMTAALRRTCPSLADGRTESILAGASYNPYYEKFVERFGVDHQWYFDIRDLVRWRWHIAQTPLSLDDNYFHDLMFRMDNSGMLNFSLSELYSEAYARTLEHIAELDSRTHQEIMEKIQERQRQAVTSRSNGKQAMHISPANMSMTVDMLTRKQLRSNEVYERASPSRSSPGDVENFNFMSHRVAADDYTRPFIVANLPVNSPVAVMGYLAYFYSGRVIPEHQLIGVITHLYQVYRAMPAIFTAEGIEFVMGRQLNADSGRALACELIALCPDTFARGYENTDVVKALARMIRLTNCFYLPLNPGERSERGKKQ